MKARDFLNISEEFSVDAFGLRSKFLIRVVEMGDDFWVMDEHARVTIVITWCAHTSF